jgi:MFS family permease
LLSIIGLFFLTGLVTSSQVLTYPVIAELNPRYLTSTAVSIDSSCIMISGFIFQPLFGWIMELSGKHPVVNGVTVYTAQNFNHAMLIMPVAFFIALLVSFCIRETYCNSQV